MGCFRKDHSAHKTADPWDNTPLDRSESTSESCDSSSDRGCIRTRTFVICGACCSVGFATYVLYSVVALYQIQTETDRLRDRLNFMEMLFENHTGDSVDTYTPHWNEMNSAKHHRSSWSSASAKKIRHLLGKKRLRGVQFESQVIGTHQTNKDGAVANWFYADWVTRKTERDFTMLDNTCVEIGVTGLYYVYAQLTSVAPNQGFRIIRHPYEASHHPNGSEATLATCSQVSLYGNTLSETLSTCQTCFTAGIFAIHAGDKIAVQQLFGGRAIRLNEESSFFGLIQLA